MNHSSSLCRMKITEAHMDKNDENYNYCGVGFEHSPGVGDNEGIVVKSVSPQSRFLKNDQGIVERLLPGDEIVSAKSPHDRHWTNVTGGYNQGIIRGEQDTDLDLKVIRGDKEVSIRAMRQPFNSDLQLQNIPSGDRCSIPMAALGGFEPQLARLKLPKSLILE